MCSKIWNLSIEKLSWVIVENLWSNFVSQTIQWVHFNNQPTETVARTLYCDDLDRLFKQNPSKKQLDMINSLRHKLYWFEISSKSIFCSQNFRSTRHSLCVSESLILCWFVNWRLHKLREFKIIVYSPVGYSRWLWSDVNVDLVP